MSFCFGVAVRGRPNVGARRPRAHTIEDAHFTAHQGSRCFLGVADGVGSWHAAGIDPALYATRLMDDAAKSVAGGSGAAEEISRAPAIVLHDAWLSTQSAGIIGSCTAAVVAIDEDGAVAAAGVGDVSVLVFTRSNGAWSVAARLAQGMRGFNFPEQLGFSPGAPVGAFVSPASSAQLHVPAASTVQPRLVLVASDGLPDNLFEDEILAQLDAGESISEIDTTPSATACVGEQCGGLRTLAARLADSALARSLEHRNGPFALAAAEHDIVWKAGGRPDDISVLLCRAGPANVCARCA